MKKKDFLLRLCFFSFLFANIFVEPLHAQMDAQTAQVSTLSPEPTPLTPAVKPEETSPLPLSPSLKTTEGATPLTPALETEEAPPPKKEALPEMQKTENPDDKKKVTVHIQAERVVSFPDLKVTQATGMVILHYRETSIRADALQMDDEAQLVYAYGNIFYEDEESKISGEAIKYDLKTEEGVVFKGQGGRNPVYFKSKLIRTLPKRTDTELSTGTTCNKDEPHYSVAAKRFYVIPGNRAVAKNITFFLGKTKVFRFPIYVASLKEKRRQPFQPQFGHNELDGWFLKNTFSYSFTRDLLGNFFFDYFEKRGTGKGFEQILSFPRNGEMSVYLYHMDKKEKDSTSLLSKLNYRQPFPDRLSVSAAAESRNETTSLSFGRIEMKTFSSNVSVDKREKYYSSVLNTTYRTFGSVNQSINLGATWQQTAQLQPNINASLFLDFQRSDRKGDALYLNPNDELNWRLEVSQNRPTYQLGMKIQRREDLDGNKFTQDNFSVRNIVPELTLRMPLSLRGNRLPLTLSGMVGRYDQTNQKTRIKYETRLDLQENLKHGKNTNLSIGSFYTQDWYNNGAAQYTAGFTPALSIQHTRVFSTRLNYNWQESRGFTPLGDRQGNASMASGGFTFDWQKKYVLTLTSGFDFKTDFYQIFAARLITKPYDTLETETTAEYDFNRTKGRNLTQSLLYKPSDVTHYRTIFNYDMEKKKGVRWDNELGTKLGPWWQLLYKNSYSPQAQRKFVYNDILLVRDLHCWEARFSYRSAFKQIYVELSIKAFPTEKIKLGADPQGVSYEASFLNF